MAGRLQGKRAFITAAAAGIGLATAQTFIAEGASVIATDVDEKGLSAITGATLHRLDVTSSEAVETIARDIGPVDILVNAAGWVHHGTALDTSEADWDRSFDINVTSMFRTIHAFLPGMLEKGGGSIINIASGASSIRGIPFRYAYGSTKAAVIGLTKSVAADFIRRNIRANAVCPGTIDTPSLAGRIATLSRESGKSVDEVRQAFIDRQPIGRLGTAQEVAWLITYLASDESSYTTGQVMSPDGGFSL